MSQLAPRNGFAPATLSEAMEFSKLLAESSMVPRQYQGKPQDVLVCVQWGNELGLAPMQALQNIAVINGKPSVYGDAAMALVQNSPVCEDIEEYFEGEGTANPVAVCVASRKGRKPVTSKFSVEDAKRAGLWGKQGPWSSYPKRMLAMRARGFALRDAFADVLKGLITVEEAQDFPAEAAPRDITPVSNPLDQITHTPVDNVVQLPVPEPVDNLAIENAEAMEAAQEDAEDVVVHSPAVDEAASEAIEHADFWPLSVPGKDDQNLGSYHAWSDAYEALCEKVTTHGKMAPQTKLEKLKALHDCNSYVFEKMPIELKVNHIGNASVRRDRILGGENAATT